MQLTSPASMRKKAGSLLPVVEPDRPGGTIIKSHPDFAILQARAAICSNAAFVVILPLL